MGNRSLANSPMRTAKHFSPMGAVKSFGFCWASLMFFLHENDIRLWSCGIHADSGNGDVSSLYLLG